MSVLHHAPLYAWRFLDVGGTVDLDAVEELKVFFRSSGLPCSIESKCAYLPHGYFETVAFLFAS